jgi:hypothetical protein
MERKKGQQINILTFFFIAEFKQKRYSLIIFIFLFLCCWLIFNCNLLLHVMSLMNPVLFPNWMVYIYYIELSTLTLPMKNSLIISLLIVISTLLPTASCFYCSSICSAETDAGSTICVDSTLTGCRIACNSPYVYNGTTALC